MIFRVNKTKDYTVMSNTHLRDKRLSLKAKGLLSQMLSLPDDWDFSLDGIVSANRESKSAIMSALEELKEFKYLSISRKTTDNGRFDYLYEIFESPYTDFPHTEKPHTEKPHTEKPHTEKPHTENQTLLNTNIPNTKKLNTKETNTKKRYVESDALNAAIIEWLNYKKEKRQTYQKTGLAQLIKKINRLVSDHGEAAVIKAIYDSMANGWAGIYVKENKRTDLDESKTDLDDIF